MANTTIKKPILVFPNYSASQNIITAAGSSYTILQDGYIDAWASNGANATRKPLLRLSINNITVAQTTGSDETYTYTTLPMMPVKAGDVVKLVEGSFTNVNIVRFYPLRS